MKIIYRWHESMLDRVKLPIRKFLADEDPEGLIHMGAPKDEYDGEADHITIALLRHAPHDEHDIFYVVWPLFKAWLGYKEGSTAKAKYMALSSRLFKLLKVRARQRRIRSAGKPTRRR